MPFAKLYSLKLSTCETDLLSLTGPALQVTVISPDSDDEKSWTLPKALLFHNSGYFRRIGNFKEVSEGKVTLTDFEPETFKLFVEFLYFGRYSYRDDLEDYNRIRDSAKAWVMGDYLHAVEFKNFAIKNLHEIYFPAIGPPRAVMGPKMIEYCYANSYHYSPLCQLCMAFLIRNWHREDRIVYQQTNREEWGKIWVKYPEFNEALLFGTNRHEDSRMAYPCALSELLEELEITYEPQIAHDSVTKTDLTK